ncbi:MAG: NADH-quinone oxidoreductase subunit NuoK [Vampirovibrionales bacterium]
MDMTVYHYIVLATVLFLIGLFGVLTNRHLVRMLMCVELMLNAVNICFIAINNYVHPSADGLHGHIFSMFILTVSAAEAALGLAIVLYLFRLKRSVDVTQFETLHG